MRDHTKLTAYSLQSNQPEQLHWLLGDVRSVRSVEIVRSVTGVAIAAVICYSLSVNSQRKAQSREQLSGVRSLRSAVRKAGADI